MKSHKSILFLLILILTAFGKVSVAQSYLDIITEKSCGCLEKVSDSLKTEELHMQLGVCMLDAAGPYNKQLKADYGIDLEKNDDSGEKLGKMVGMKMATKCPTALMKLANRAEDDDKGEKSIRGVVTKIETEQFVVFSVKDEQGKIAKFYWFTFIESSADLPSKYKDYVGKTVDVTYANQEFFDPKIAEYRAFSVIYKLDVVK